MSTALIAALLAAAAPADLHLDPAAAQRVSFELHHPLVTVRGSTGDLEGVARLLPDGSLRVQVRAPIQSFRTGIAARDVDLDCLLESERYPYVTVRALVPRAPDARAGSTVTAQAKIRIDLHGRSVILPATVRVTYGLGGEARVVGGFAVDLTAFAVEPPSVAFLHADKTLPIAFDLSWSGGSVAGR
jgi:polyisoprenoid-binding protein YceI